MPEEDPGPDVAGSHDASYLPIAHHGLIGDLRTCALVGSEGTIDWFCAPRFDSPSIFGSILDADGGGSWRLESLDSGATTNQFYFPDSNILVTRFMSEQGVAEVHDFMPLLAANDPDHRQRIVRRVFAVRGRAHLRMAMAARPDYGRVTPDVEDVEAGVCISGGGLRLGLSATVGLESTDGVVTAELALEEGEGEAVFVLEVLDDDQELASADEVSGDRLLQRTAAYWRDMDRQVHLPGPLARDGEPLRAHPEAAHARAVGGCHRLADHEPARGDRRLAELGLPLRLDPRRGVQPLWPVAARIHRGGGQLHALAVEADEPEPRHR